MNLLDPQHLLTTFGALGVFLVLFAETGLLIGVFLPGDSLLFTAGVLAATSASDPAHLSLPPVLVAAPVGAVLGAQVGYVIGRRGGRALLEGGRRPKLAAAAERAEGYLARYGYGRAIVLARFIPLVRTVLNPLAGIVKVPVRVFTLWQVVGGVLWALGVAIAGYLLGSAVPNIDTYLLPIIALVVIVSLIPVGLEVLRSRRERGGQRR